MPTFTYKSRVRGKVKTGEVEAEDEKAAVSKLKLQNIRVTTIKKKAGESALFGHFYPSVFDHGRCWASSGPVPGYSWKTV